MGSVRNARLAVPLEFRERVEEILRIAGEEARELAEEFGLNRRQPAPPPPSEPAPQKQTYKTGTCAGCGGSLEELTRGCKTCRMRHRYRVYMKYNGYQHSAALLADKTLMMKMGRPQRSTEQPPVTRQFRRRRCSGCQGPLDEVTIGCVQCRNRVYNRRRHEKKRASASGSAPAGAPGSDNGRSPSDPQTD